MTKTPSDLRLSSTLWLPTAFMAVAVLTGCAGGFDDCPVQGGCGPRTQVNLDGTLSGLVGSEPVLQNSSPVGSQFNGQFSGPSSNAIESFLAVPLNSSYNLTVQRQPTNPAQTCVVTNGSGTAGTADVTNILVTCITNPPRFAYVANSGSNNVSAYSV